MLTGIYYVSYYCSTTINNITTVLLYVAPSYSTPGTTVVFWMYLMDVPHFHNIVCGRDKNLDANKAGLRHNHQINTQGKARA